jgi:hypothetical protein
VRGTPGAGVRVSLRLDDGTTLAARGSAGILCRDARHELLAEVVTEHVTGDDVVRIVARAGGGGSIDVTAELVHRLPVVFGGPAGLRLLFASCRVGGRLAGWVELPSA